MPIMASKIDILEPFNRIQPGPFISKYEDWIIFTLLLFLFWAVAGISLRKRFEESRYLRVLVTAVALMLSVGTYYSIYNGWLHLSLQGLGFFGAILLFIVIFFIVYGLMRGYGMHVSNALSLGFLLFYISLWAVSPNILHTVQEIFPPLNGILLILFIISIARLVFAFFQHAKPSSLLNSSGSLQKTNFVPDSHEIDQELATDTREQKLLKNSTMKLTQKEIRTLASIEAYLKQIIKILKERGNSLSGEDTKELMNAIQSINKKENILRKGMDLINEHLALYKKIQTKDISQLEKRLTGTKNIKEQNIIKQDIAYLKKMLEAVDFIKEHESTILKFIQSFNSLLTAAMQKVEGQYPHDALEYLKKAYMELQEMKHIYKKQREIERFLLKINRKNIDLLKNEKKN